MGPGLKVIDWKKSPCRPNSAPPCAGHFLAVQCFGTGKRKESVTQNPMASLLFHSEALFWGLLLDSGIKKGISTLMAKEQLLLHLLIFWQWWARGGLVWELQSTRCCFTLGDAGRYPALLILDVCFTLQCVALNFWVWCSRSTLALVKAIYFSQECYLDPRPLNRSDLRCCWTLLLGVVK